MSIYLSERMCRLCRVVTLTVDSEKAFRLNSKHGLGTGNVLLSFARLAICIATAAEYISRRHQQYDRGMSRVKGYIH